MYLQPASRVLLLVAAVMARRLHVHGVHGGVSMARYSSFAQYYRLGYKILVICVADGRPHPSVVWFKNGRELIMRPNVHVTARRVGMKRVKSRLAIDPATLGDEGVYTCVASNRHGRDHRSFDTKYRI